MKKLKDPEKSVGKFLERGEVLGKKLGPILFQLPPRWKLDSGRLEAFLQALPGKYRYAFEFRDPSWFSDRESLDYEIDGIVIKVDDLDQQEKLGTRHPWLS